MYKILNIFILIIFLANYNFHIAQADSYSKFLYPTYSDNNNNITYFNQYNGSIVKKNILNSNEEILSDIVPSATSIVQISPDQSKILIYTPNISYPKYKAPFFDDTQKSPDQRWWLYDLNSKKKVLLGEKINLVSWYSNNEIIYVFNNQEVSIAPIDNLSKFSVLYKKNNLNIDINKPIISNNNHQIVSLKDGYIIGNKNKFKYVNNRDYKISANPNLDFFLESSNNSIRVLDWDGVEQSKIDIFNLYDFEIMDNRYFLVLLSDGQIIRYTLQGNEDSKFTIKSNVNNIYSLGLSDKIIISNGDDDLSVYDLTSKESGTSLLNIETNNLELSNGSIVDQNSQQKLTKNSSMILLVGGILFLVAGVVVFIWKLKKR